MSIFSNIFNGNAGNEVKQAFDDANNAVQNEINNTIIATNTALIHSKSNLNARLQQESVENELLRKKIKDLEKDLKDAYREIRDSKKNIQNQSPDSLEGQILALTKENNQLKENYEFKLQLLKDWMHSQRAFKELAMKYAIESLGKTKEEVMAEFQIEKENVINNVSKYGNNINELKY